MGQNFRYEYMKVAIIGAGISGLSIAKRLSEKNNGFVIDVYEAALDQVDESHPLIGNSKIKVSFPAIMVSILQ